MSDDQGELHDLRTTVDELARRVGAGFREDLAQIRAIAAALAERDVTDDVRALRAEVGALAQRDDDFGRAEVLARFQALEAKLDAAGDGERAVAERLEQVARTIEQRLDGVATADQVGRLAGDLRAHLADALGALDGDAVIAELVTMRAQLGGGRGTVVEQLQDHLADVASGEVVGALWDEVRAVREAVDGLGGRTGGAEVDVSQVLDSVATLRAELAAGLVVEPSGALSASLDAVRAELDGLRTALSEQPDPTAGTAAPAADLVASVHEEIAAVHRALDEMRGRLGEGMVGDRDGVSGRAGDADVEVLADQIAALSDLVSSEVDGLRQAIGARPDQDDQRHAAPTPVPAGPVALDDTTMELLRDEVRAAGAISDQVIDALRDELKALRRRIAVKAAERVLDDDQLAQIADAVATRLAKG